MVHDPCRPHERPAQREAHADLPSPVEWIDPRLLSPHPRQVEIYGEEGVADLIEAIRVSGWIKPLVIIQQNIITAGHRRRKAAIALNWRAVPVERRTFGGPHDELEALLLENRYREKTPEQRVREAQAWKQVEQTRAAQRRVSQLKQGTRLPVQESFSERERGQTREKLAERVGFGTGRTYEKAEHIVRLADSLAEQGKATEAQTLLTVLDTQSVEAAAQVLKLQEAERLAVLHRLAYGTDQKVKAALLAVRREEIEAQAQATPHKPRISHARWQDWLPSQPACDLLLTDPPYSTEVREIDAFARSWLPQALAKVKPTGRAYIFVGAYAQELRAYLQVETSLPLAQILVWSYLNTIGPTPHHEYKQNWQAILYYRGPQAPPLASPLLIEQTSVMQVNAPDGRRGERYHAWQKPDELAERLIRHATRAGDLVLDCFAGTGTFVLAAHHLGRRALGCDSFAEMLALAQRRGCEIAYGQNNLLEREGTA
jgi:DNA modification methylase